MELATSENTEIRFAFFVGDAVFNLCSNNHLGSIHEIFHHVFKGRNQGLLVAEQEKVNLLICSDLESHITSREVNISPHVLDRVIQLPSPNGFLSFV